MVAVRLDVEPDQIGAKQSIQQLTLPRTDPECLRIGPRYMPENRQTDVRTFLLNVTRQQREVIILRQDHRTFDALYFIEHDFRKLLVHLLVISPVARTEDRASIGDMAERPQTFVGEAEIVSLFLLRTHPDSPQRVLRMVGWHAQPVMLVNDFRIRVAAAVSDPGTITRLQNWL